MANLTPKQVGTLLEVYIAENLEDRKEAETRYKTSWNYIQQCIGGHKTLKPRMLEDLGLTKKWIKTSELFYRRKK